PGHIRGPGPPRGRRPARPPRGGRNGRKAGQTGPAARQSRLASRRCHKPGGAVLVGMNRSLRMSTHGAVLITGASSGMGRACALRLAERGFTVFAAVRKERDAQEIREGGSPRLIPVILDVTQASTIAGAFRTVRDSVGAAGLAGLVNNAGVAV